MDAALRAAQWKHDNALPPIDERQESINGWLESQACTDWIAEAVDTLTCDQDVIWHESGRRREGIFSSQLNEKVADEYSEEWQAFCDASFRLFQAERSGNQERIADATLTADICKSNLLPIMRAYAYQIVSGRAAEYAAHLIDKEAADASEWGV